MEVHTFGHGTRRYPGSRRNPQFGQEAMSGWLDAAEISYGWLPALGGRRSPSPSSTNVGLRNPQFRAYADVDRVH